MIAAASGAEPKLPLLSLLAAALLAFSFWPISSTDIDLSYVPWLMHMDDVGPAAALSHPFGDYTPPYYYLLGSLTPLRGFFSDITLVKLASLLATLFLSTAVLRLLLALQVHDALQRAAYLLILPGIIFNAAVSASCDALWAAPAVLAMAAAVQHRHRSMLAWCGVALAVKAQAIFAAPFFLGLLLARRVPVGQWFIMPAALLAMYLPALLLGWPLGDLLTVYFRQAGFFERLSLNAPNIWAMVQPLTGNATDTLALLGKAATVVASAGLAAFVRHRRPEGADLAAFAALSVMLAVGLLPHMHERYFYLADVLVFCWAVKVRTRSAWNTAILTLTGSSLGIAAYIWQMPSLAMAGGAIMIAATVWLATILLARPAEPAPAHVA
jgi:Gpi18-like mannosyltransferase